MTYQIRLSAKADRMLAEQLPEKVAAAITEFIFGPLAENPYRVGKQLRAPFAPAYVARRGEYRIIYQILRDAVIIEVLSVAHRRDAYRT